MRVFDLHCDTLTCCMKAGETLSAATGHISLARGKSLAQWGQVFAVFVPDTLCGQAAANYAHQALDFYDGQKSEIQRACTPVLAIENGNALAGNLHRLDEFYARGVRLLTLTWNGANELGQGTGCGPHRGLTDFGKAAIFRMFELGMIPDVSHLNRAGFWDAIGLARAHEKSVWATHSNCSAIHFHPRNLDDGQLRAVFACDGLVGLNLYTKFLGGEGTAKDAAKHVEHMISLGGEDHIALGSDFDGCEVQPSLAGPDKLEYLDMELKRRGFSDTQCDKFFWQNAARTLMLQKY